MVLLAIGHALYIVSTHHDKNPKAEKTSDESVREKPKMGLGKKILIAAAAKGVHNKVNPPTVIAPPGLEYLGCKAKGMSDYIIFYREPPSKVKTQFTISRNTRSSSGKDGVDWEFHFN